MHGQRGCKARPRASSEQRGICVALLLTLITQPYKAIADCDLSELYNAHGMRCYPFEVLCGCHCNEACFPRFLSCSYGVRHCMSYGTAYGSFTNGYHVQIKQSFVIRVLTATSSHLVETSDLRVAATAVVGYSTYIVIES